MKILRNKSFIPLTGLVIYSTLLFLEKLSIIPDPFDSFNAIATLYSNYSFLLLFFIILIEGIIYLGFYFPGQLFAVLVVLTNDPTLTNIVILSFISIIAVTISSLVNYKLGTLLPKKEKEFKIKHLIVAMLHLNLLALYMLELGMARHGKKPILYAGLMNIPYYLLLFGGTFLIKDLIYTEDSYYLLFLLIIWSSITLFIDFRKKKNNQNN